MDIHHLYVVKFSAFCHGFVLYVGRLEEVRGKGWLDMPAMWHQHISKGEPLLAIFPQLLNKDARA